MTEIPDPMMDLILNSANGSLDLALEDGVDVAAWLREKLPPRPIRGRGEPATISEKIDLLYKMLHVVRDRLKDDVARYLDQACDRLVNLRLGLRHRRIDLPAATRQVTAIGELVRTAVAKSGPHGYRLQGGAVEIQRMLDELAETLRRLFEDSDDRSPRPGITVD
ncbi:hypothetical protein [Amycolatopsis sp. NPDC059021]|uniref:hypothetical protein n=1 Tax=Amycolatopsis sp. NPDC059021 TaxID=3346704 RepID=UPI003672D552